MFTFLKKIVTKMVSWAVRKLGGGFKEIGAKLESFSINIEEDKLKPVVLSSMDEIDLWGKYSDIPSSEPIPKERIIETTDKLSRNYLSTIEVFYRIPGTFEPRAEYISILHDENISNDELQARTQQIIDRYASDIGLESGEMVSFQRMSLKHLADAPY